MRPTFKSGKKRNYLELIVKKLNQTQIQTLIDSLTYFLILFYLSILFNPFYLSILF